MSNDYNRNLSFYITVPSLVFSFIFIAFLNGCIFFIIREMVIETHKDVYMYLASLIETARIFIIITLSFNTIPMLIFLYIQYANKLKKYKMDNILRFIFCSSYLFFNIVVVPAIFLSTPMDVGGINKKYDLDKNLDILMFYIVNAMTFLMYYYLFPKLILKYQTVALKIGKLC